MKNNALEKKKLIRKALAETMKENRGNQSMFKFSSENDIPLSIVSEAERGEKDPQLTTIFKLAESYSLTPEKFIAQIRAKLPKDFYMIEK